MSAILEMTTKLVNSQCSNQELSHEEIGKSLMHIHNILNTLKNAEEQSLIPKAKIAPIMPTQKTIKKNYIVCLECGGKFKTLSRHMSSQHNMTCREYKQKWGINKALVCKVSLNKQREFFEKNNMLEKLQRGRKQIKE